MNTERALWAAAGFLAGLFADRTTSRPVPLVVHCTSGASDLFAAEEVPPGPGLWAACTALLTAIGAATAILGAFVVGRLAAPARPDPTPRQVIERAVAVPSVEVVEKLSSQDWSQRARAQAQFVAARRDGARAGSPPR